MSQFILYNYQFTRIESRPEADLFGGMPIRMTAEEAFPKKQEILNILFLADYYNRNKNTDNNLFLNSYLQAKIMNGYRPIAFSSRSRDRKYPHKYLMKPTDDIIILRIANPTKRSLINERFEKEERFDYPNCIVIIDNRPGIQRLAIEVKTSVFKGAWTLCNILQYTLNEHLKPYSLGIELMHLQESHSFWHCVHDRQSYPKGFHKIKFHLPYLNLERLHDKVEQLFTELRKSYNGKMDWEITAPSGGELTINQDDELQCRQITYMMEEVGGDTIELVPNDNKKKSIWVGRKSPQTIWVSNTTIDRLVEDAADNQLFSSPALDRIKIEMKKGI